jgi:O-antigen ligase
VLFAWALGSVVWAHDPGLVLGEGWKAALAVFAALAIVAVVRRREHALWLVAALVAGPVISALVGLVGGASVEGFAAGTNTFGRLTGGAGDANQLAAGLVPAIALALGLFVAVRHPAARLAALAAVGVGVIGIAASESRGGLIGLAALMVFLLVLLRGGRAVLVLVMAGAVLAALLYVAASPHSLDRITSFDAEGTGRADLWRVAWQMALDNPLGVGLDNFRAVSWEYAQAVGPITHLHHLVDRPVVAHSTYLQLLAETGVVGLVLFAGVAIAAVWSSLRAASLFERAGDAAMAVVARASAAALLGFLVAAAFISFAFSYRMWALLALGPALLTVAGRRGAGHVPSGGHAEAS